MGAFGPALAGTVSWYRRVFATDNSQSRPRLWRGRCIGSANVIQRYGHIDDGRSPVVDGGKPLWEAQSSCRRELVMPKNQACNEIQATLPVLWSCASPNFILTQSSIQILGVVRAVHLGQTSPSPHCKCQYGPNIIFAHRPTLTVS